MFYKSTRGHEQAVTSSQAILQGIAPDGGLFVPDSMPKLDKTLDELIKLDYKSLAYEILKVFLTDYTESELKYCIDNAYDEKFSTNLIAPLVKSGEDYFLELFHGKTSAFKDMALSILPYLLTVAMKKNNINKKVVILTATSGDTGIAALEGFKDVENTEIVVFYPDNGVSNIQKEQMTKIDGSNTYVYAVDGNFDDAQNGVKKIFVDEDLKQKLSDKGYVLSSANSINIGRLLPQIVYYFYAYSQMVQNNYIKLNDKINFTVPTGNFGNILAGYFAKQLGLPIDKLICASNENKVLYDFLTTKTYDINREFILTISPSMDILISSNLERLLYLLSNDKEVVKMYSDLKNKGVFTFLNTIDNFCAEFIDSKQIKDAIKEVYKNGYVIDTHTAVAYGAYKKLDKNLKNKNVFVSTASPYKFVEAVLSSIININDGENPHVLFQELEKLSNTQTPKNLKTLNQKPTTQNNFCKKDDMKLVVENLFF